MHILLVEDNKDLAQLACAALGMSGYHVTHAACIDQAFAALEVGARPAAAVLDINVGDRDIFPVADRLEAAGIPFFFASAAGQEQIPKRFLARHLVRKPYTFERLLKALRDLTTREASQEGGSM